MARAQAQAIDPARRRQRLGGIDQPLEARRRRQLLDLLADRRQHVRGERLVALQFLAEDLDARLAGKAEIAVAHGSGIELAHLVIAVHAETFGKPRHGRRLHAGLTRLLAHRQQRHVARAIEHVARACLQLRGHVVERLG